MRLCSIDGCERKYVAQGFCGYHYKRAREKKEITVTPKVKRDSVCTIDYCLQKHEAKGLCRTHYDLSLRTPCIDCQTLSSRNNIRCVTCRGKNSRGTKHPNYRTGKSLSRGYIILSGYYGNPNANRRGRIAEHILITSQYPNRPIEKWETVHHIDRNPENNNITNLQLRIGPHGKGSAYKRLDCDSVRIGPTELKGGINVSFSRTIYYF